MRILVVGRSGQVARALLRRGKAQSLDIAAIGRPDIDLEQVSDLRSLITHARPDVVINAAAYTAVDRAEDEPERAFQINGHGAGVVARAAAEAGAAILYLSTDYVFDGEKPTPYTETDAPGPRNVYGASKLEGERQTLATDSAAIVVRTSWVFDSAGSNFVRTMLKLALTRPEITVVADQIGSPTYADDLADALLAIAHDTRREGGASGILHCAGAGETSWFGFAAHLFALSRDRGGPTAAATPITTADFPTRASRPANSRLDCSRLASTCDIRLRPWQDALAACVDEIAAGGWSVT